MHHFLGCRSDYSRTHIFNLCPTDGSSFVRRRRHRPDPRPRGAHPSARSLPSVSRGLSLIQISARGMEAVLSYSSPFSAKRKLFFMVVPAFQKNRDVYTARPFANGQKKIRQASAPDHPIRERCCREGILWGFFRRGQCSSLWGFGRGNEFLKLLLWQAASITSFSAHTLNEDFTINVWMQNRHDRDFNRFVVNFAINVWTQNTRDSFIGMSQVSNLVVFAVRRSVKRSMFFSLSFESE